ncbi:MAG: SPOR domain-containing protein [Bacteroidetes bacterium]|nr:SPOR domain-containing protein [Bacteroidota bacterium]MCH8171611.1 SPOR domain-containing protein [Bacteroidota bacterium]MCH8941389.1 SPOR domain-containing protein [Bacteroidota bacterium]
MRKILLTFLLFLILSIMLISCSSSTEISNNDKTVEKTNKKISIKEIKEDFIITPYRTKIKVKPNTTQPLHLNIWYGYNNNLSNDTDTSNVFEMVNGFRVQILSTDNLEQARRIKKRVLQKINQKRVHILFDPPFYKVQIGDFTVHSLAEDLNLKLKQLGYSYARVVREKINHYR